MHVFSPALPLHLMLSAGMAAQACCWPSLVQWPCAPHVPHGPSWTSTLWRPCLHITQAAAQVRLAACQASCMWADIRAQYISRSCTHVRDVFKWTCMHACMGYEPNSVSLCHISLMHHTYLLCAASLLGSGLDAKARTAEGNTPGVLRDCVLLKPGSNTVDLFEVRTSKQQAAASVLWICPGHSCIHLLAFCPAAAVCCMLCVACASSPMHLVRPRP